MNFLLKNKYVLLLIKNTFSIDFHLIFIPIFAPYIIWLFLWMNSKRNKIFIILKISCIFLLPILLQSFSFHRNNNRKIQKIVISREKKGFLGLFGKKPAQVDIDAISETTVVKANQQAVKGVPKQINDLNEPVKTVSEATVDLGHVVEAIKKIEEEGQGISDEVKAEILKHERHASTILEETGHIEILNELQLEEAGLEEAETPIVESQAEQTESQELEDLGLKVEPSFDIEQVATEVTTYVQTIIDDMDVEATISNDYNRRSINLQIDTNEPGRIIGYHGKVLKALQLLAQNYLYNRYSRTFYITINVNDYVEHRAEVLQTYAQKLATRVLEEGRSHQTDPMSNSERKIIHRIISRMDGVTSYSEGDEPNRYVVVDTE